MGKENFIQKAVLYTDFSSYRNKCEFTIGINHENQLPTVGFRISAYVNGTTAIGPVEHLDHIPDSMKLAVKVNHE